MSSEKSEKQSPSKQAQEKKDRAAEVANIFEWLITAFILAFVFRAFVMEAFRIPTGSMADTLKGDHFRLRCRQCGYKYEYGFHINNSASSFRHRPLRSFSTRCPSCGNYQPTGGTMPIANGDRILVLKCIYQFFEPKRWDVIVFKNPTEPSINYIKRLIGLPGDEVHILDGDIYVNGQISRKPPHVQDELWMPVYDNDYQPVNPYLPTYNHHRWTQPFGTGGISKWEVNENSPTIFTLESEAGQISTMPYSTVIGNNFRATYAYDNVDQYRYMPYCSDLKVRFYCSSQRPEGGIGISLSKYETDYKAWVDFTGGMVISKNENNGQDIELVRKSIEPATVNKSTLVAFANVDHRLVFEFGDESLIYDLGRGPNDAGEIKADIQPRAEILGSGKLVLSHIAIFRDIHYTDFKYPNGPKDGRAVIEPFTLNEDEFFVLGDNSPNSEDGRWWSNEGIANEGVEPYRAGVVPRDYLVGKALFVYWPSGFKPFARFPIGIIPNVGRMRFIYGGSNGKP
jgi:signal peptidase I